MTISLTDMTGIAATTVIIISWLPQLWKSYTTKKTQDISWGYLGILFVGIALWIIYGYLYGSLLLVVGNTAAIFMVLLLSGMKYKYELR